jgi:acyl-coenzyme A thioesterase PaaI-like protein
MTINPKDTRWIKVHALRSLSSNRAPGMHFPGYFMRLACRRYEREGVELAVEPGPHCVNAEGLINRAALLFTVDMVLAGANRVHIDPNVRTATLMLRVDFTGAPAHGLVTARGVGTGFSTRTALPESSCAGTILCEGGEVMRCSGVWVAPPAPKGMVMHGLPWEGGEDGTQRPLLQRDALEANEKDALRRVARAIRQARNGDLLEALWNPVMKRTPYGALGKLAVGMHLGNRVGHVQGGLLMSAALVSAEAAVPEHPITTGASAWYISPGQGKAVTTRSTILQSGRNIAVVRTELFNADKKRVLEVVSNHAAAPR